MLKLFHKILMMVCIKKDRRLQKVFKMLLAQFAIKIHLTSYGVKTTP